MSTRPFLPVSNVFNPSLFSYESDYLTLADADLRYVRIGGDIVANTISCNQFYIGGNLVDVSAISGVTAGTITANKAAIVDANKDIDGFRNLTATGVLSCGNLTLTASNPIISSANPVGLNKTITITGDGMPTTMSGLSLYHIGMASTSYINAYSWMSSTQLNLNLNNGALVCQADGTVVSSTPAVSTNSTRIATTAFVQSEFLDRAASTFSPSGFQNQTDSVINYDANTRVLTISPVSSSFTVWVKGTKHVYSTTQTATAHTNAVGTYIFYFDDNGVLQWSTSTPSYANPFVADIYYFDNSHTLILDERHGSEMDFKTHTELHLTMGTFYRNGLALSGYTVQPVSPANSDNTFASATGQISDEDLVSTIQAVADGGPYAVMLLVNSLSQLSFAFGNSVPYLFGTYIQYNQWTGATWTMTDVANGDYINYYVVYLPSIQSALQMVLVPGQTVYSSLALAVAEDFSDLSLGNLTTQIPEYLVRYRITFRANAAYTSSGKCRIEQLDLIVGSRAIIQNSVATNHQALSGLQIAGSGNTYGHINDGAQSIAGDKTFTGNTKTAKLLVGTTTDTSRLISALTGSGNASLSLGALNSDRSQVELTYVDSATAADRKLHLGLYGAAYFDTLTVRGNLTDGSVGICQTSPAYPLDLTGDFNLTGQIRNGATIFMNSSGVLQVAGQSNITSVGTLTKLTTSGTTSYTSADITNTESLLRTLSLTMNNTSTAGTDSNVRVGTWVCAPTLTATNTQTTNVACSLFINGDPIAGANQTVTNKYALWANGKVNVESLYIAGALTFDGSRNLTTSGTATFSNTTEATNYNAASVILAGGLGTAKKIWANGDMLCAGNVGIKTSTPLFGFHMQTSAADRTMALYCTAITEDYYGFGTASSSMLYHAASAHRFYLGSLGNATGTKYMDLSTSGLFVSGYVSDTMGVATTSSLASAYNVSCVCNSNTTNDANGIAFVVDNFASPLTMTPAASIRGYRVGAWSQGGLAFSTKGATTQTGALTDRMYINENGIVNITSTQASSSTTTGALTVAGGLGCNGQVASVKCATTTVETTNLYLGGYQAVCDGQDLSKTRVNIDGAVYANKCLIVDSNSDIGTIRRLKASMIQVGNDFTDTGRMISSLDSTVVAGNVRYWNLGQANSGNNSAELSYYHSANGSSNNELRLGKNGGVLAKFRFDGTIHNGSTQLFNSSGQLTANLASTSTVDVSTRIVDRHPDGMQIFNSDYNDTEFRLYCTSYNAYCGTWGNGALRLITGGTTMAYFGGIGSQNISFHGTSTSFPVSIQKNDGISASSYGYINSGGNTGTASNSSNISLYTSGRILCTGECDCISDRRVKKDICDVKQKFVDRFINDVDPKCFIYKHESALSYGYIAQECLKAGLSRFVQMHENKELEEEIDEDGFVSPAGQEFSINTAYFIPLLHMKVKQQEQRLVAQDKKIKELEDRLNRLSIL